LPEYRDEAGTLYTYDITQPDWYAGPAVYEVDEDGVWTVVIEDVTIDEILTTWDFPPRPEESAASE